MTSLGALHWPADGAAQGLFELWAGERLVPEKALPRYRRPGRPISVSAVPFCPGISSICIWQSLAPVLRQSTDAFLMNFSVFYVTGELGSRSSHFHQRAAVMVVFRRFKCFFSILRTPSGCTRVPIF